MRVWDFSVALHARVVPLLSGFIAVNDCMGCLGTGNVTTRKFSDISGLVFRVMLALGLMVHGCVVYYDFRV